MKTRYFSCCFLMWLGLAYAHAQQPDTLKQMNLDEVVVSESRLRVDQKASSMNAEVVRSDFLQSHFSGNMVQAIENIPGIQSMDIGSGSSKPMIRGMAFNRIAVADDGVKQEGQQWGADHGLEVDAFGVSSVRVTKGPASILYGSDAMGGVIELLPPKMRPSDQLFGEVALLGKSVNDGLGASLMLGLKKGRWQVQARYSEQRYGDYRVPTDSVVYLTRQMPIYGRRMKNTAGQERDASLLAQYEGGPYKARYSLSNVWQKSGFFPGAHGIPDISRLQDDGDSRNIDLPYAWVNHLKAATHQQYQWHLTTLTADLAYQFNHREEWSAFHTHYASQPAPTVDADKELEFRLHTASANVVLQRQNEDRTLENSIGFNAQLQGNSIAGYGFLLPEYARQTAGVFALSKWHLTDNLLLMGGLRYDWGHIKIEPFDDPYLAAYLAEQGYGSEASSLLAADCSRNFNDVSGSIGLVWTIDRRQLLKVNAGRSFRLPAANELSANGVHHGTFRHEQGDPNLNSERGWQADLSYSYQSKWLRLTVSPFVSLYENYIFLAPTGEWSVLPHAGQVYRFQEARARLYGGEASVEVDILPSLTWRSAGEYVRTRNCDAHTALAFSPPTTLRNSLTWHRKNYELGAEAQTICRQEQVAHNEDVTPGATLLHLHANVCLHVAGSEVHVYVQARNVFNTKYYNHLSFYRKIEIPEPGRNFSINVQIPFQIEI